MPLPPMGQADLMRRAQQGDPDALATLNELGMQLSQGMGGGGMPGMAPPGGMAPPVGGGGMPSGGPQGAGGLPPGQSIPPGMIQGLLQKMRGGA